MLRLLVPEAHGVGFFQAENFDCGHGRIDAFYLSLSSAKIIGQRNERGNIAAGYAALPK
jgi:hypothetical protein